MHPYIADLMVTERIDRMRAEAHHGQHRQTARLAYTRGPGWRARLVSLVHGGPGRPRLTTAPRRG
jgi:hypothetical protein